jgi:transcriptional regulator GlxA family with amidase domain
LYKVLKVLPKRSFSEAMQGKNLRFVDDRKQPVKQARVGFLLLEHFSLPAYTQALDTMVTANLISPGCFATESYSLTGESVTSDLGLVICPGAQIQLSNMADMDLLVICGGLRTPLKASPALSALLHGANKQSVELAGLWNGAWFLGQAGLLDGYKCAIHPENRAVLAEVAKNSQVTSESYMVDGNRLTAASPSGAFHMVMEWIRNRHGRELADGITDILAFEESRYRRARPSLHDKMSEPLRNVVQLMAANIEEPLSLSQIAEYVGRSRRQIERLFQDQMTTTPVRYYLELRLTEGRRLLQHSDLPILDVSLACGFVSSSHFSKCYTEFYGYPPSKEMRFGNVRSSKGEKPGVRT